MRMVCRTVHAGSEPAPPLPGLPPEPPPCAYFAEAASDPVPCPVCCECCVRRPHLIRRLVRDHGISAPAELSWQLARALHASPPGLFHRCPLCTFLTASTLTFSQQRMLGHGPLRLDTPPPVRRVCVVVEPECPTCHRRTAATHAQRHRRTTHAGGRTAAAAVAPPAAVKTGTPPHTRRTTGPRVQVCAACHYALFTIPGILCHACTHHAVVARLAVPVAGGRPQSVLARPMGHRCPLCPAAFIEPEGLKCRQAAERGIGHPSDFEIWSRLRCEETPRHPLVCGTTHELRSPPWVRRWSWPWRCIGPVSGRDDPVPFPPELACCT
ncbi:hypothetical protein ABB37_09214 [Leptomonas pyrrhocoris]|uniref:Uncharacterized protein n=2 Tax=Leptomonas pyrrhocoris TaxID=157538 RepID=A0A0N0VD82_LEPPY|nr:hypothetical protein ABB37_09214 [Leptomonas pyrrhocoris]KPA74582.1 hypothetical protein ABB37_09214 [Leptomonas pyrrhocoris]|eukprot:XP_015653021.1 hypothetical protein ABB37_09214 [Leptomonas pyrrhocoris]